MDNISCFYLLRLFVWVLIVVLHFELFIHFACALQLKTMKKNQQVVPKILTVMNSPIVQSTSSDIVS